MSPPKSQKGFTLIELMVVVLILGLLAAMGIPNYISMRNRAREGGVKANLHAFQLASEDYGIVHDGAYSDQASAVAAMLPAAVSFDNPFTDTTVNAYEDRASMAAACSAIRGITSYADSATANYNIKGYGNVSALSLVLTAGQ